MPPCYANTTTTSILTSFIDFNKFNALISVNYQKSMNNGGETGIRTLGTFDNTHTFQACALNHSATSPLRSNNSIFKN